MRKISFCEIFEAFNNLKFVFLGFHKNLSLAVISYNLLHLQPSESNMLEIILVQGFCPLEIKITQFPNGFPLQPSLDNCMTTPFSIKFLVLVRLLFEERTQYLYQQKLQFKQWNPFNIVHNTCSWQLQNLCSCTKHVEIKTFFG